MNASASALGEPTFGRLRALTIWCLVATWLACAGVCNHSKPWAVCGVRAEWFRARSAWTKAKEAIEPDKWFVIARGQRFGRLALDATHVYWTSWNEVWRAPKAGGDAEKIATSPDRASDAALDDTHVYWIAHETSLSARQILRVAKTGGAPEVVAPLRGETTGLVVRGGRVYWFDGTVHRVRSAPSAGGEAVDATPELASSIGYLAIDDVHLYFSSYERNGLLRVGLDGGDAEMFASGEFTGALSLDADSMYYSRDGSMMTMAKTGTTPIALASGVPSASAIAVDDAHVYWGTNHGGKTGPLRLYRVSKAGGPVVVLAERYGTVGLAVDRSALFVSAQGVGPARDDAILVMPK